MFKNVPTWVKYGAIAVLFIGIIGLIVIGDRAPEPVTAALTPDQVEEQELIKQIASGSVVWQKAKAAEDIARAERIRQEQGNAGYRHTLCTKFKKIVTESGAVIDAQLSADGSSCIAVQGF